MTKSKKPSDNTYREKKKRKKIYRYFQVNNQNTCRSPITERL